LKPGFIREEHISPGPVAIKGEKLPTEVYDNPGEDDEHTDELP
jgi:hypothetical protein